MLGTSEQRPGTNAMSMMKSNTFGYAQNCGTSKMKWLMVNNAQVCGFNGILSYFFSSLGHEVVATKVNILGPQTRRLQFR